MQQASIDRIARALSTPGSRRLILPAVGSLILAATSHSAWGKKKKRDEPTEARRKRRSKKQRDDRKNRDKSSKDKNSSFSRDCRRFVISAGPDRDDKFQHIDDDLLIELIPKGKKGGAKTLLEDDNDSPNGNNGDHLKVNPFTARVGDKIHIVARNEAASLTKSGSTVSTGAADESSFSLRQRLRNVEATRERLASSSTKSSASNTSEHYYPRIWLSQMVLTRR
jgi:hypothetical protein